MNFIQLYVNLYMDVSIYENSTTIINVISLTNCIFIIYSETNYLQGKKMVLE